MSTPGSLSGRRLVVIGGGSGIGFAVASLAQALGGEVVIASRDQATTSSAIDRLPGASGQVVDLRDEAATARFFAELGRFDHLVITAGDWSGDMFTPARDLDLDKAREAFAVRFWGVLTAVREACRTITDEGSITLTSGMLSRRPVKGSAIVTAIAGAVEHLTQALAVDLAPIRVNVVSPSLVLTEHTRQMPQAMIDQAVQSLPLPRAATPEEAAQAYLYSVTSRYVTGQVLQVDGGASLV